MTQKEREEGASHTLLTVRLITYQQHSLLSNIPLERHPTHSFWSQVIDFFYGFCINDTDLQEITKTEVGITKAEVADFWLLYKYKSLTIYLNRPNVFGYFLAKLNLF